MTNCKPSRATFENELYKTHILNLLINSKDPMTATDVAYQVGISTQKAAALLNSLKFNDRIVVTHLNNKMYYKYGTNPTATYTEKETPQFTFTPKPKKEEPISLMRRIINYFNPPLD